MQNIPMQITLLNAAANIEDDWQVHTPAVANCETLHLEAKNLFEIEGGCPRNSKGRNNNPLCLESKEMSIGAYPRNLSLWTRYGAAGPFTNSEGTQRFTHEMCLLRSQRGPKLFNLFILL